MNQAVRYDVVEAPGIDDLIVAVQDKVGRGWRPLGGPFVFGGMLLQAVVWIEDAQRAVAANEVPRRAPERDLDVLDELTEDDDGFDEAWRSRLTQLGAARKG